MKLNSDFFDDDGYSSRPERTLPCISGDEGLVGSLTDLALSDHTHGIGVRIVSTDPVDSAFESLSIIDAGNPTTEKCFFGMMVWSSASNALFIRTPAGWYKQAFTYNSALYT